MKDINIDGTISFDEWKSFMIDQPHDIVEKHKDKFAGFMIAPMTMYKGNAIAAKSFPFDDLNNVLNTVEPGRYIMYMVSELKPGEKYLRMAESI